jgi:hypothetical protein
MHTKFWPGKRGEKKTVGRLRRRWEDNIRMDVRGVGNLWTVFNWLRIGTNGGIL